MKNIFVRNSLINVGKKFKKNKVEKNLSNTKNLLVLFSYKIFVILLKMNNYF